jgi:uncharacterized OsmC-like protein
VVTFTPDFTQRMRKRLEFYREADRAGIRRELVVQVQKHDNLLSEASVQGGDITWFSDEPRIQGGSGRGVSPLAYFVSSLGLCQFVHYAEHASTRNIPITSIKMAIKARYSVAHPRVFEEITYTVDIESPAEEGVVADLARASADDCYVTNTLKSACKVTGFINLNGKQLLTLV